MKNRIGILFIILSPLWFVNCSIESAKIKSSSDMLTLNIQIPKEHLYLNQPISVKVSLVNDSNMPVLINSRLSVGYEKSVSRELYADIRKLDTGKPAKYFPNDVNRNFAVATDYKSLLPGDSIFTTFNLLEYYPLKETGHYELVVHYQADEKLASPPKAIWAGILSSQPESFEILSGQLPNVN